MDKIDHLAASKVNYRQCVYSLAARDFNKAHDWISSALTHLQLHIDITQACNLVKDRAIMRSISDNAISSITQEDFLEVLSNMHSTVDPAEISRLESFD